MLDPKYTLDRIYKTRNSYVQGLHLSLYILRNIGVMDIPQIAK